MFFYERQKTIGHCHGHGKCLTKLAEGESSRVFLLTFDVHLPDTKGLSCPVQFTDAELVGFHELEQLWFDWIRS
jgi:hypothetical protein